MAKNRVQFQRGLSFKDFQNQSGPRRSAGRRCSDTDGPKASAVLACDDNPYCVLILGRFQGHACHHQTLRMPRPIFAGTKLPLTIWFLAIYLLTQSKNGIWAMELGRQLEVSYITLAFEA